jgi:hypothetical protein
MPNVRLVVVGLPHWILGAPKQERYSISVSKAPKNIAWAWPSCKPLNWTALYISSANSFCSSCWNGIRLVISVILSALGTRTSHARWGNGTDNRLNTFETKRNLLISSVQIEIQFEKYKVRFEFFTAVTMKNGIFWDVTPCGSCKNRYFGGT